MQIIDLQDIVGILHLRQIFALRHIAALFLRFQLARNAAVVPCGLPYLATADIVGVALAITKHL